MDNIVDQAAAAKYFVCARRLGRPQTSVISTRRKSVKARRSDENTAMR